MFLNREKETSRVSTLEIISFSSDCFSGFLSLIEVKDGGLTIIRVPRVSES